MIRHQIITPEQVIFHYEIAGLATRAMAWTVDWIFLMAARLALLWLIARAGGSLGRLFLFSGVFAINFGYYLLFETFWVGQSAGKRLMRLRVMAASGGKLRFPEIFVRNLMRLVDSPLDLLPLGGLAAFFD